MDFVQIAVSSKGGGYYYDFPSGKLYHVPPNGLPDQSGESVPGLGWGLASGLGAAGLFALAQRVQDAPSLKVLLAGVLLLALLTSALLCWLIRRGQRQFSQAVRQQCRAITPHPALLEELRRGQKLYVQLGVYIAVLFAGAAVCLVLLVRTRDLPFALCFLIFFDAGCMMAAILRPFGKRAAHAKLRHQ